MSYVQHLRQLEGKSPAELEDKVRGLVNSCPLGRWPAGMPASIDPKVVLIGVSPGNSPGAAENRRTQAPSGFRSEPSLYKESDSHFYWPDSRRYWEKLRFLAQSISKISSPGIDERSAISVTTHLNLGTGSAGAADETSVEKAIIKWVSYLLGTFHNPDFVFLFGLNSLVKKKEITEAWEHPKGLSINWHKPHTVYPMKSYQRQTLKFREWDVTNRLGHTMKVVTWPNHPSRPPFTSWEIWQRSVEEFCKRSGEEPGHLGA